LFHPLGKSLLAGENMHGGILALLLPCFTVIPIPAAKRLLAM
jgi:hypothetical protein